MENESIRYLATARELLAELERPDAYTLLGLAQEAPFSEIQKAFQKAFSERTHTGYSIEAITEAQRQLKDAQKRLELDSQSLHQDEWLRELENLRNRYALFDFLADI